jgi:hypothetical protein
LDVDGDRICASDFRPDADRLGMITAAQTQNGITTARPATDGAMWEAVRDRVPSLDAAVVGSGGGVNVAPWGGRLMELGDALWTAARHQSMDNAPLLVFATVGAVLTVFMLRS